MSTGTDDSKAIYFRFGTELAADWDHSFDAILQRAQKTQSELDTHAAKKRTYAAPDTKEAENAVAQYAKKAIQTDDEISKAQDKANKEQIRRGAEMARETEKSLAAQKKAAEAFDRDTQSLTASLGRAWSEFQDRQTKAVQKAQKEQAQAVEKAQKDSEKSLEAMGASAEDLKASLERVGYSAMNFGRGLVYIHAASQDDLDVLIKLIAKFEGYYNAIRGGYDTVTGLVNLWKKYKEVIEAVRAAELALATVQAIRGAASGAAGGGGSSGGSAVGSVASNAAGSLAAHGVIAGLGNVGGVGAGVGLSGAVASGIAGVSTAVAPLVAPVTAVVAALAALTAGAYVLDKEFNVLGGDFAKGGDEFWEGLKTSLGMQTAADKSSLLRLGAGDSGSDSDTVYNADRRSQDKTQRDAERNLNRLRIRANLSADKSLTPEQIDQQTAEQDNADELAKAQDSQRPAQQADQARRIEEQGPGGAIRQRDESWGQWANRISGQSAADTSSKAFVTPLTVSNIAREDAAAKEKEALEDINRLEEEKRELTKKTQAEAIDGLKKEFDIAKSLADKLEAVATTAEGHAQSELDKYHSDIEKYSQLDPIQRQQLQKAKERLDAGTETGADRALLGGYNEFQDQVHKLNLEEGVQQARAISSADARLMKRSTWPAKPARPQPTPVRMRSSWSSRSRFRSTRTPISWPVSWSIACSRPPSSSSGPSWRRLIDGGQRTHGRGRRAW